MNSNFRSFFSALVLAATVLTTGCANPSFNRIVDSSLIGVGTGAVIGNIAEGSSEGTRKGAEAGLVAGFLLGVARENVFPSQNQNSGQVVAGGYQQPVAQQRSHPGCQGGARPYFLPDGRPACEMQQQQPQQQQMINCNSGGQQPTVDMCRQQDAARGQQQSQPQQQQCGIWNPDCNRQLQAPVIAAPACRMVNVLVQDQYGRQFYQQQRKC